jgi:RNA polymerase sigma-70 factor (ECF subfamily)
LTLPLQSDAAAPRVAAVYQLHELHDPNRLDDGRLLHALRAGDRRAPGAFFERFSPHVERILTRIFGADADVSDLVNDTFFRALERIGRVYDSDGVKPWLTSIAVFVAREHMRHQRRRKWLQFLDHADLPEQEAEVGSLEMMDAVRRLYRVLAAMPSDERIAFTFRFVEGMELAEIASACDVSLATAKRLLARAESRFAAIGRRDPVLREWLEGGTRWADR